MFFANIMGLLAANNIPVAKYGPPPNINVQPAYGIQPTPPEIGSIIFTKFLPYIAMIAIISLAVGLYLNYRKKQNVKRSAKKR